MELIDNYNKENKKVKLCENGCGRLIYWNSNENAYFGVESGQKQVCADQDPNITQSQAKDAASENFKLKHYYYHVAEAAVGEKNNEEVTLCKICASNGWSHEPR